MKGPAEFSCPHVERPYVSAKALLLEDDVRHRLAEDDHVADNRGCAGPAIPRAFPESGGQIDPASVPEVGNRFSGQGVERVKVLLAVHQDSPVGAIGPIDHTASRGTGQISVRSLIHRLLNPERLTRGRVERLHQPHAIGAVQDAVHHEGLRAEGAACRPGSLVNDRLIDRRPGPDDPQVPNVVFGDLAEGRVSARAIARGEGTPLSVGRSLLGAGRHSSGTRHGEGTHRDGPHRQGTCGSVQACPHRGFLLFSRPLPRSAGAWDCFDVRRSSRPPKVRWFR